MDRASWKTAAVILSLASAVALAAPTVPDPSAATNPADVPEGPLRIVITQFSGTVQVRQTGEAPWTPIQVGQEYDEGVEFRTGVRSAVKFRIPPDSEVTLDRLGVVKVLRAAIENGTIKTDVGMKYGRTRYDIEAAGRVHDATIRSSSSVLAIRGTDVVLDDNPGFAPRAVSFTGRAKFTPPAGPPVPIGSKGGDPNRPVRMDGNVNSPAATGLVNSITVSPLNAGRTPLENQLVVNIPQTGGLPPPPGTPAGGGGAQLQSVNSTPLPPIPPEPPVADFPSTAGRLEFVLTWQGTADLNIGVVSPLGEPITTNPAVVTSTPPRQASPIATTTPRSGAVAGPDVNGSLGGGTEIITWPNGIPTGRYDYGVKYNAGQAAAQYKLDVVVNGVVLEPSTTGTLLGPSTSNEFEGNAVEITTPPAATTSVQRVSKKKKK